MNHFFWQLDDLVGKLGQEKDMLKTELNYCDNMIDMDITGALTYFWHERNGPCLSRLPSSIPGSTNWPHAVWVTALCIAMDLEWHQFWPIEMNIVGQVNLSRLSWFCHYKDHAILYMFKNLSHMLHNRTSMLKCTMHIPVTINNSDLL